MKWYKAKYTNKGSTWAEARQGVICTITRDMPRHEGRVWCKELGGTIGADHYNLEILEEIIEENEFGPVSP